MTEKQIQMSFWQLCIATAPSETFNLPVPNCRLSHLHLWKRFWGKRHKQRTDTGLSDSMARAAQPTRHERNRSAPGTMQIPNGTKQCNGSQETIFRILPMAYPQPSKYHHAQKPVVLPHPPPYTEHRRNHPQAQHEPPQTFLALGIPLCSVTNLAQYPSKLFLPPSSTNTRNVPRSYFGNTPPCLHHTGSPCTCSFCRRNQSWSLCPDTQHLP